MKTRKNFEDRYTEEPNTGCWIWTDAYDGNGYGKFCTGEKTWRAHRLSWTIHRGPIKEGLFVCHKCDTPACVNPDHLFLGTNRDNMLDMVRKGRMNMAYLAKPDFRMGRAKLDAAKVIDIRRKYASGEVQQKELALEYGVAISVISNIITGTSWKNVREGGPKNDYARTRVTLKHKE